MFFEERCRILDLPAACTRQVAAKQRFQHEYEWIALAPCEPLFQHVAGNREHLGDWNAHMTSWVVRCVVDFLALMRVSTTMAIKNESCLTVVSRSRSDSSRGAART